MAAYNTTSGSQSPWKSLTPVYLALVTSLHTLRLSAHTPSITHPLWFLSVCIMDLFQCTILSGNSMAAGVH